MFEIKKKIVRSRNDEGTGWETRDAPAGWVVPYCVAHAHVRGGHACCCCGLVVPLRICVCVFVICECAGERALGARTTDEGHGRRFLSGHLSLAKRRRSVRARRRRLVRPWTFRPTSGRCSKHACCCFCSRERSFQPTPSAAVKGVYEEKASNST